MTLKFSVNFDQIRKRKEANADKAAFRKGAIQKGKNTAYIVEILTKTLVKTKMLLAALPESHGTEKEAPKAEKYRLQVLITELEHNIKMLEPPQDNKRQN